VFLKKRPPCPDLRRFSPLFPTLFRRCKLLFDPHTPSCGLRAVLFGRKDILVNRIAWLLRRFPMQDDLLYVDSPLDGTTRLTEWARENADFLGRSYQSELARRLHNQSPE